MAVAKCLYSTVSRGVFTRSPRDLSALPLVAAAWRALCLMVVVVLLPVPLAALLPRDELTSHSVSEAVKDVVVRAAGHAGPAGLTVIMMTDAAAPGFLLDVETQLPRQGGVWSTSWTSVLLRLPEAGDALNTTEPHLSSVLLQARQVRHHSRGVMVVVVSASDAFLALFAKWALERRLLVWATRLLVVTTLPLSHLLLAARTHWSFSMMNTMLMNVEHTPSFLSFYGRDVNVTALPFPPYWDERESPRGRYHGTDYLMITAIAQALNFTVRVLPSANWGDVTARVEERVSFVATVIYAVFPQRLEHYDYSYMFEYAFHAFCMARPALRPRWQSLYYPLHHYVWASTLALLLLMPLPFLLVVRAKANTGQQGATTPTTGQLVLDVIGSLLGQDLGGKFSPGVSGRMLAGAWLLFAFILGTAYRGNLTASLTAPKSPPRVETLEQLVASQAVVTMPPYGAQFRDFFKQSESSDFKTLGERVKIVSTTGDGLQQAIIIKQAHMEARRYLQLEIARKFTRVDGSSSLYVARESVFPGLSAWPVPHDAPYKPVLDRAIMAVKEGGLYEKWSRDVLSEARQESRQQQAEDQLPDEADREPADSDGRALTLVHTQGPLLLVVLGLLTATLVLLCELLTRHYF
ncbi:uncharacterized protein LOC135106256 isoform X2 [Scylla paramamosain]|uniref:uncharacterized protein LOC135106256 isoform X2 n=1 Tax=Scylla paramamosain TaxID=85552 RepID=UPI003083822B